VFAWTAIVTLLVAGYFVVGYIDMAFSRDGLTRLVGQLVVGFAGFVMLVAVAALVAALRIRAPGSRAMPAVGIGLILTFVFTWLAFVADPWFAAAAGTWGAATVLLWRQAARPPASAAG
jgi:hypothetical protein